MSDKKYKLGMFIGRMQPLHLGHKQIIDRGIAECDNFIVLVGSSQNIDADNPIKARNPFDYSTRFHMLNQVYPVTQYPNLFISDIPDTTHENDISPEWGRYVLKKVANVADAFWLNEKLEAMYYGNDESRDGWYDPKDIEGIDMVVVERGSEINISATQIRSFIINSDYESYYDYMPEALCNRDFFNQLNRQLRKVPYYNSIYLKKEGAY